MMIEEKLKEIYYNTKNPASFSGAYKIFIEAKKDIPQIKLNDVKKWLSKQLIYTLHKDARKHFKRNPIIAEHSKENYQADLVDMKEFKRFNNGFTYILTVIDVFSKKVFAIALKNKTATSIAKAMGIALEKLLPPAKLQTDKGKEFENKLFFNLMTEHNINYFTTKNQTIKCSIVERFNKTLKNKMFKYFSKTGKRRYIDILDDLINSYNNTYHTSIKMTPNEVNNDNEKNVFENLYGVHSKRELLKKYKTPKMKAGDTVRKKYDKSVFDRGYYPNWTDETYIIDKSMKNLNKSLYLLQSFNKQVDKKRYYPEEIQKIEKTDIYRIEKILKEKKIKGEKYFFIKWLNFPSNANSWIKAKDIVDI